MQHDLQQHRSILLCIPSYCAIPVFLSGVGWEVENSGHVLVDKANNANAVAIVVGRLLDYCYFVSPNGTYSGNPGSDKFGDISNAKFLFVIGKPDNTPFTEDFVKVFDVISKVQNQVASTPTPVNFMCSTGTSKVLRFTRNIFEKRVSPLFIDRCCPLTDF